MQEMTLSSIFASIIWLHLNVHASKKNRIYHTLNWFLITLSVELYTSFISDVNAPCQIKDEGKSWYLFQEICHTVFELFKWNFLFKQVFDATKLCFDIMRWINTSKVILFISKDFAVCSFVCVRWFWIRLFNILQKNRREHMQTVHGVNPIKKGLLQYNHNNRTLLCDKRRHGGFGCYSHKSWLSDKVIPY